MSTAKPATFGTSQIIQALRRKFPPPAYGLLTELADATGARHRPKIADAVRRVLSGDLERCAQALPETRERLQRVIELIDQLSAGGIAE